MVACRGTVPVRTAPRTTDTGSYRRDVAQKSSCGWDLKGCMWLLKREGVRVWRMCKLDFLVCGDSTADERDVHAPEHEDGNDDAQQKECDNEAVGELAKKVDCHGFHFC